MSKFMIQGQEFTINTQEIEEKMKNITPKKCLRNMHSVEIGGKEFPIRQPILAVTGLSAVEISTLEAYLILEKLGYKLSFHK